ncbi:MAG: sensor histidine kinase [Ruminococcaceae bacterium]|nr:sensor histidine kinase [Oscillospiraceae bacterium]
MKELSLNILDIAMNSVKAGASLISIKIDESDDKLLITITDDGCGMSEDMVKRVTDPFCTTRTTRKVGLGIPFYKLAAEQTGGKLEINSKTKENNDAVSGTEVKALFMKNHIDCLPLGDIISTVCTLIQGSPDINFEFSHKYNNEVYLSTAEMRQILGDIPLNSPDVLVWVREYLNEQYESF